METAKLSEQIMTLRKNRGLTQEQLGARLGVSAQAVSKWEKGGAPDVELLPGLAEHLGVTIDTLFGRSEQELEDMPNRLNRWLAAFPPQERMMALFRLLAESFQSLTQFEMKIDAPLWDTCYTENLRQADGEKTWIRSKVILDCGMALGVLSRDFPLYLLLPEPKGGYRQHFAENEEYRRLFAVLSRPGSLEILEFLYGKQHAFFTPDAVAKHTDLPSEKVQELMAEMEHCHLLDQKTLEVAEGSLPVYILHDTRAFVPFLYLARWFMQSGEAWFYGWDERERPILETKEAT